MKEVAGKCAAGAPEPAPTEVILLPTLSDVPEEDEGDADACKYIIVYTSGRKVASCTW